MQQNRIHIICTASQLRLTKQFLFDSCYKPVFLTNKITLESTQKVHTSANNCRNFLWTPPYRTPMVRSSDGVVMRRTIRLQHDNFNKIPGDGSRSLIKYS